MLAINYNGIGSQVWLIQIDKSLISILKIP